MTKRYLNNDVGCALRTEYYLLVRRAHPTKTGPGYIQDGH